MGAYYNENDPFAAEWLRNLIMLGEIAYGDVDERSIEDVTPEEIKGYTQCHFFAGIGVWSYALRLARWPDNQPVWTGSCPCQPFSAAGKGAGFNDERHLWPSWYHLIQECQPAVIFGEQVASKDAEPWIDLVQTDLEAMDYAFGCVPFPSAGVGSPQMRDRAYWVGDANRERLERHPRDDHSTRRKRAPGPIAETGLSGRVESPSGQRRGRGRDGDKTRNKRSLQTTGSSPLSGTGPTNGFWRDADWILCRDGRWRPVEPSTFPLAYGATSRVGRLRGYGNSINAQAAKNFIETVMEL